ncbi:MAG: hypothetical protein ACPLZ8_04925 [Fervidicoccaceae archaeon]
MKCNSKLVESGYRKLKCLKCGFEADRDLIGALNNQGKAITQIEDLLHSQVSRR